MGVHSYWTSQGNALYSAVCAEEIYYKTCFCHNSTQRRVMVNHVMLYVKVILLLVRWHMICGSVHGGQKEHISELYLFMDVPVIYTMYTLRGTARMQDRRKLWERVIKLIDHNRWGGAFICWCVSFSVSFITAPGPPPPQVLKHLLPATSLFFNSTVQRSHNNLPLCLLKWPLKWCISSCARTLHVTFSAHQEIVEIINMMT